MIDLSFTEMSMMMIIGETTVCIFLINNKKANTINLYDETGSNPREAGWWQKDNFVFVLCIQVFVVYDAPVQFMSIEIQILVPQMCVIFMPSAHCMIIVLCSAYMYWISILVIDCDNFNREVKLNTYVFALLS